MFGAYGVSKDRAEVVACNIAITDGEPMNKLLGDSEENRISALPQLVWPASPSGVPPQSWNVR